MNNAEQRELRERILRHRMRLRAMVEQRDGRLCFLGAFCGRMGTDLHEIDPKRSDYPLDQQVEKVFTLENSVLLCRQCHQDIGQTKFGVYLLKYLLWLRHGKKNRAYKRPEIVL